MSLEKAIKHGKERRSQYYDSRAFDSSCRNNRGCPACESNRFHSEKKRRLSMGQEEVEILAASFRG